MPHHSSPTGGRDGPAAALSSKEGGALRVPPGQGSWHGGHRDHADGPGILGAKLATAGSTPPPVSTAKWQQQMKQLGCRQELFHRPSYPTVWWRRTRCTAAPHRPYAPAARHPRPAVRRGTGYTAGNGTDYSAEMSAGSISAATGGLHQPRGDRNRASGRFAAPQHFLAPAQRQALRHPGMCALPPGAAAGAGSSSSTPRPSTASSSRIGC